VGSSRIEEDKLGFHDDNAPNKDEYEENEAQQYL
jgi:hypothetical protein